LFVSNSLKYVDIGLVNTYNQPIIEETW